MLLMKSASWFFSLHLIFIILNAGSQSFLYRWSLFFLYRFPQFQKKLPCLIVNKIYCFLTHVFSHVLKLFFYLFFFGTVWIIWNVLEKVLLFYFLHRLNFSSGVWPNFPCVIYIVLTHPIVASSSLSRRIDHLWPDKQVTAWQSHDNHPI